MRGREQYSFASAFASREILKALIPNPFVDIGFVQIGKSGKSDEHSAIDR